LMTYKLVADHQKVPRAWIESFVEPLKR